MLQTIIIIILLAFIYYTCFLKKFPLYEKLFNESFEKIDKSNKLLNEIKEWKDDLEEISDIFNNQ